MHLLIISSWGKSQYLKNLLTLPANNYHLLFFQLDIVSYFTMFEALECTFLGMINPPEIVCYIHFKSVPTLYYVPL